MLPEQVDYRVFDLKGSHAEIGGILGRSTPRFTVPAWWPAPPPAEFALACADHIRDVHPVLLDEYRTYADAQQVEAAELWRRACRTSLRMRAVGGCSSFAWQAGGHMVVGRNYDFRQVQRVRQRIRLRPDRGLATVGMLGSVPGGRYDGVNERGLFVSLHVVMGDQPDVPRPGVPFHFIPRILLETCPGVGSALDTITRIRHLNSFNYLLADPDHLAAVEAHPDRVRVRTVETGRGRAWIDATNHFRHPDMVPLMGSRLSAGSKRRAERIAECLQAAAGMDGLSETRAILRDHTAPLCDHRPGNSTLWSLTADLTARRTEYARGQPCCTDYEPVEWPR